MRIMKSSNPIVFCFQKQVPVRYELPRHSRGVLRLGAFIAETVTRMTINSKGTSCFLHGEL